MMQIKPFSDKRHEGFCAYCGGYPDTRDHVPSKVLLDRPFPNQLPVVASCKKCNEAFSLDEEYFASVLECSISGTTEIEKLQREKIRRILSCKDKLHKRVKDSFVDMNGQTYFQIEPERFKNVILKLARGHAKYETSEHQLEAPTELLIKPVGEMTNSEVKEFFSERIPNLLPEIGSRSFQRFFIDIKEEFTSWITVQPQNYRYSLSLDRGLTIKMFIRDYLAVKVMWM